MTNYTSVLFTGYAPVHFQCFYPIYQRLQQLEGVKLYLSGGIRAGKKGAFTYDHAALYGPFGIPDEQILPIKAIHKQQFDMLFSANKRIMLPIENVKTKVQIFHGVSFRNRGVRVENLAYDYFFIIGPYMQRKFVESGFLCEDDPRIVPVGFPKTDALCNGSLQREALLAQYGLSGQRPILLYAPTGVQHNSLETMGAEVIQRLAATNHYDLLIKPHDHPKMSIDWFAELAPFANEQTILVRDTDVIPLLYLADLLITDASSVANEFALLNRPIVYLDVPELLEAAQREGALVDLATWGRRGGVVVEDPSQVTKVVAASLANPRQLGEVQTAIAQDLFYNPGRASEAAVAWFQSQFSQEE